MHRSKQTSKPERCPSTSFLDDIGGQEPLERYLLEFMDSFDIYLFLYDPSYRRRLNSILDSFTEEEFESFERAHSKRFTVN